MGHRLLLLCGAVFLLASQALGQSVSELLEFVPVNGASEKENMYLDDGDPEVIIDAMSKTTRTVYFLGVNQLTTHSVRFACEVSRRTSPLSDVKLCCGSEANSPICHRVSKEKHTGSISCNRLNFKYSYDQFSGANFSISFNPVNDVDFAYNGQLYCEVYDNDASIQSNEIDLRDARFYRNQLGVEPSNTVNLHDSSAISPNDFPLKFPCGNFFEQMKSWPSWMAAVWQRYLSPFEWAICPVGVSTTPAGCVQKMKALSLGDSVTSMDGTLYVLNPTVLLANPNSAFVCYEKSTRSPIVVVAGKVTPATVPKITRGLSVDVNAPSAHLDKFEELSPSSSKYQFIDGTILENFHLRAFYRTPKDKSVIEAKWYKDGNLLADPDSTMYSFRLPERVDRSFAGEYSLKVTQNGYIKLTFVFTITVVGPPKFKDANCISDLFYAMEGDGKRLQCYLAQNSDVSTRFKISINGFEADTPAKLKHLLSNSLQLKNQPISHLDINFWEFSDSAGRGIGVEVKELKMDQNFRLSVKAVNQNGQSQVAGTVRVVPKPALKVSPARLTCESECSEEPFDVKCVPTDSVLRQWAQLNITTRQGWVIDRTYTIEVLMQDEELAKFFKFDQSNPSVLKVSPFVPFTELSSISTTSDLPKSTTTLSGSTNSYSSTTPPRRGLQQVLDEKLQTTLPSLGLECRFQLFVQNPRADFVREGEGETKSGSGQAGQPRKRRQISNEDETKKIYDSYNEKNSDLMNTLTATRFFPETGPPSAANFAWIAAVIIAIIFILIVIIVGIWLCTRDRGETYKLSKKEYKLGNDPLRELKEKETFQAYERPEEPPSLASGLEEPDLDVGSDDDGELDAYNMDPAKPLNSSRTFNEEASYIGQYSSPSRVQNPTFAGGMPPYPDHHTAV